MLASSQAAGEALPTVTKPVILVVEDDPFVRGVTCEMLELAGYQVLESTGPSDALKVMAERAADVRLILSDLVMPGMNGLDLAHRLQQLQPGLRTLFMSGHVDRDLVQRLSGRAAAPFLRKPFTMETLLARVADAMEISPTLRTLASSCPV